MATTKKHGPLGELWLYRDDYETEKNESDIYNSALLKPDLEGKGLLLVIQDFVGAGPKTHTRNNDVTYAISTAKLRELIEKHGKKVEEKK